MSADIIARGLALQARPVTALAADVPTLRIALSCELLQTHGYAASGKGAGTYVCDALATSALASAHPRFCKQSLDGR